MAFIVFDLDGTLIDSAPSILQCFAKVLDEMQLAPRAPLTQSLIGPPLLETLRTISGIADQDKLQEMVEAFKQHYDTTGYLASRPYPQVEETLSQLQQQGHRLGLVTNKRIAPTQLILQHFNWAQYFSVIAAMDSFQPPLPNKAAVLSAILKQETINLNLTIYIGDTLSDAQAAEANGMRFIGAGWGYGTLSEKSWQVVNELKAIPEAVN